MRSAQEALSASQYDSMYVALQVWPSRRPGLFIDQTRQINRRWGVSACELSRSLHLLAGLLASRRTAAADQREEKPMMLIGTGANGTPRGEPGETSQHTNNTRGSGAVGTTSKRHGPTSEHSSPRVSGRWREASGAPDAAREDAAAHHEVQSMYNRVTCPGARHANCGPEEFGGTASCGRSDELSLTGPETLSTSEEAP